jgi:glycosyltransferase involved in cell wall biosynthesis
MEKLRLSVLITAFNVEKFIVGALESVLAQTRKPDQIVLVDDGSTDATEERLEPFKSYIEYYGLKANSGVLNATIFGLSHVHGDIVSFLDGDDIWHPQKLELVEKSFRSNSDLMILSHNYKCIDENDCIRAYTRDTTYSAMRVVSHKNQDADKRSETYKNFILSYKGFWLGSAWSLRIQDLDLVEFKKTVEYLNVHIPEFLRLSHQDQPLAAFIITDLNNKGKHVDYIDRNLFYYRVHPFNTSGSISSTAAAIKSAYRAFITVSGTANLVGFAGDYKSEFKIQVQKKLRAEYIYFLYSRRLSLWSIPAFFNSFFFMGFSIFLLEFIRLILILVLGLRGVLLIKRIFIIFAWRSSPGTFLNKMGGGSQ